MISAALSLSSQTESLNLIKGEIDMSKGISESHSQEVVLLGKKTMKEHQQQCYDHDSNRSWKLRHNMRLKNLFELIALPVAFVLLTVGCTEKKDSKKMLLGQTFYYAEPCKEENYCKNIFTQDSIIEMEFEKDTRTGTYRIPMQYHEEGIIVQDGEKLFPCHISNKEKYISIHCKYEEERGIQILWRTLKDAKANRPECQNVEKECKESQSSSAPKK